MDTMFHPLSGVIGIKIVESDDVKLWQVSIDDLKNVGEDSHWICQEDYKLPNGQTIKPVNRGISAQGAKVTGMEIVRSSNMVSNKVEINNLYSDEGKMYWISWMIK